MNRDPAGHPPAGARKRPAGKILLALGAAAVVILGVAAIAGAGSSTSTGSNSSSEAVRSSAGDDVTFTPGSPADIAYRNGASKDRIVAISAAVIGTWNGNPSAQPGTCSNFYSDPHGASQYLANGQSYYNQAEADYAKDAWYTMLRDNC